MGENIEVKDVQKTEYLDKNGLDMLWAKVKENTRNQVEVESNRAVTQETRIIETKADKAELNNYVSDTALKALEKKVSANTAAISGKQNAGNYLHYETLNNEGYYEIPSVCISGSDDDAKTNIDSQSISVNRDDAINYTTITCDGISNTDNNANHVYATDGSIADLTQYAKISDAYLGCIPYYNKYTESDYYSLLNTWIKYMTKFSIDLIRSSIDFYILNDKTGYPPKIGSLVDVMFNLKYEVIDFEEIWLIFKKCNSLSASSKKMLGIYANLITGNCISRKY